MATDESILTSTKKVLGITEDYTVFDVDIMMHINSVFGTLNQLGIGPADTLYIDDKATTWSAFTQEKAILNPVKSYMYLRVKMLFDPPATSFGQDAFNAQIRELEWRLNALEPAFNNGDTAGSGGEAYIWDLSNGADFPTEAIIGAIGIDFVSGDVWRKV